MRKKTKIRAAKAAFLAHVLDNVDRKIGKSFNKRRDNSFQDILCF
jgi:hypothetical protein